MTINLNEIADKFRTKGLNLTIAQDKDDEFIVVWLPSPYEDYGVSLFFETLGDELTVIVWESFAGTQLSQLWTTNYEEILAIALLKVVTCDIAIANF